MGVVVLVVALAISGIAAWYSIAGLAAIFAAAKLPVILMGSVLEVGKLVTASWLYQNWKKVPFLLKSYLTVAVVVLMLITSMGIYGFLSKAHLEQTINVQGNTDLQIESLERQISVYQTQLLEAEAILAILDRDIQTLQEYDRIRGPEGAIAVREAQKEERAQLNQTINNALRESQLLYEELAPLKVEQLGQEAEVGPIRYIAELFYDSASPDILEKAVRGVILTIIFVFDPLAVLLLIAANMTLAEDRKRLTTKKVISFTDMETPPTEEDIEADIDNATPSQLEMLIEKIKSNPKSQRAGTFLNMKYKKLLARKEQLDSEQ